MVVTCSPTQDVQVQEEICNTNATEQAIASIPKKRLKNVNHPTILPIEIVQLQVEEPVGSAETVFALSSVMFVMARIIVMTKVMRARNKNGT